jgi:putative transposase
VHHSDRGVQYLCHDYVTLRNEHRFLIANSAKGNPYHNAFVGSFMKTLKQEQVYLSNYETYLGVVENLPTFIEKVYNKKPVHSGIDYLIPSELEEKIKIDPSLTRRFARQL